MWGVGGEGMYQMAATNESIMILFRNKEVVPLVTCISSVYCEVFLTS